ncbi:MAG: hypothetical protein U0271_43635 [Polyangiaceae bacterium]
MRRASIFALATVLALLGCKRNPTFKELGGKHKDALDRAVSGAEAIRGSLDKTPAAAAGAPCKVALKADTTEVVTLFQLLPKDERQTRVASFKGAPGDPPIGRIDASLKSDVNKVLFAVQMGTYDNAEQRPTDDTLKQLEAEYDHVRKIDHLLVLRGGNWGGGALEAFVVGFPSGAVECGFSLPDPADVRKSSAYDPATGDEWSSDTGADREPIVAAWVAQFDAELKSRFGLSLPPAALKGDPASTASDADQKTLADVAARFRGMVAELDKKVPDCAAAPPAGALRLTSKRLRALAQASALEGSDANVLVEPLELVAKSALDFLRAPQNKRATLARALLDAPATRVVALENFRPAMFGKDDGKFEPAAITAREVELGPDGVARCVRKVDVVNSEQIKVVSGAGNVSYVDLAKSANADLVKQIATKLPQ